MCKLFVNVLDNVSVIVHLNTGFIDKALFDFFFSDNNTQLKKLSKTLTSFIWMKQKYCI